MTIDDDDNDEIDNPLLDPSSNSCKKTIRPHLLSLSLSSSKIL